MNCNVSPRPCSQCSRIVFSGERLALPARPVVALRGLLKHRRAKFVIGPAVLKVADGQLDHAAVVLGIGIERPDGQRLIE